MACALNTQTASAHGCVNAQLLYTTLATLMSTPVTLGENITTTLFDPLRNPSTLLCDVELAYAMSARGQTTVWFDASAQIVAGSRIDRVIQALFLYNANVTAILIKVESDNSSNQCSRMHDALVSTLTKASVKGCGWGRGSLPDYDIQILHMNGGPTACFLDDTITRLRARATLYDKDAMDVDPPDSLALKRRRSSQSEGPMLLGNVVVFDQLGWRPVSDMDFTPKEIYTLSESDGRAITRRASRNSRAYSVKLVQPVITGDITYEGICTNNYPATNRPINEGRPTFKEKPCAVNSSIIFGLFLPHQTKIPTALSDAQITWPLAMEIYAASSPLLHRWRPIMNHRKGSMAGQALPAGITQDVLEMKRMISSDDAGAYYEMEFTPKVTAILGHLLLYFHLPETVSDTASQIMIDVSFVCGSTGLGMDSFPNAFEPLSTEARVASTSKAQMQSFTTSLQSLPDVLRQPFMVWNVQKLGGKTGKSQFINAFGVWTEAAAAAAVTAIANAKKSDAGRGSLITLGSDELTFESAGCVDLIPGSWAENNIRLISQAVQDGKVTDFFVIPVHWKSGKVKSEIRDGEIQELLVLLEQLRLRYSLAIIVAGDFNLESPLGFSAQKKSQKNSASKWVIPYAAWGVRPFTYASSYLDAPATYPSSLVITSASPLPILATKICDGPAMHYDFIWQPYVTKPTAVPTRLRFERTSGFKPQAFTDPTNCFVKPHRTMSREFSDHHPVIFDLLLTNPNIPAGRNSRIQLVSFNIRHFRWSSDNPFNPRGLGGVERKRSQILRKYLQNFPYVALQEIIKGTPDEVAAVKVDAEEADDDEADDDEADDDEADDEEADDKEADVAAKDIPIEIQPHTTQGNRVYGQKNALLCTEYGLGPTPRGPNPPPKPDMQVCIFRTERGPLSIASIHDRYKEKSKLRVTTRGFSQGSGENVETFAARAKRQCDDSGVFKKTECEKAPLIIAGDWNADMKTMVNNIGSWDEVMNARQSMVDTIKLSLGLTCTTANLTLPGVDDTAQVFPNNVCAGTGNLQWATSLIGYYDFLFYCLQDTADSLTVRRAKIDQWMVGFRDNEASADPDDCGDNNSEPDPYAGQKDNSGCSENSAPGALDKFSDHRPVYIDHSDPLDYTIGD
ncbi:hypothetical protein HDU87_004199 [Geranomyces variabilis]|uniref:Endonuclease/exonuclease/phosphatase domain-containing protein n=1 Tax=Geranomyces variabilis TaxID=109894 RepID=A0AAD5XMR1_9FUNG|nr:hypothetical protein HDU87_004199 [Geranomyces variabilis]